MEITTTKVGRLSIGLRKEMSLEIFKEMWRLDNAKH